VEWLSAVHGVTDDINMDQIKLSTNHYIPCEQRKLKGGKINQLISSHSKCTEICTISLYNPQLYTFIIIFYHSV
jgi:hypothetical protein